MFSFKNLFQHRHARTLVQPTNTPPTGSQSTSTPPAGSHTHTCPPSSHPLPLLLAVIFTPAHPAVILYPPPPSCWRCWTSSTPCCRSTSPLPPSGHPLPLLLASYSPLPIVRDLTVSSVDQRTTKVTFSPIKRFKRLTFN